MGKPNPGKFKNFDTFLKTELNGCFWQVVLFCKKSIRKWNLFKSYEIGMLLLYERLEKFDVIHVLEF